MLVAARLLLWFAPTDRWTDQVFHLAALDRGLRALLRTPIDFLLTMAAAAAAVVLAFDLIERLRRIVRHRQSPPPMRRDWFAFSATQLAAGAVVALLLVGYEVLLGNAISATSVDALHFSLHPLSAARLAFASGLVLAQAVVFWAGVLAVVLITVPWRTPRTGAYRDGGFSAAGSTGPVDCDFSAHHWRRALHRAGASDGVRGRRLPRARMGHAMGAAAISPCLSGAAALRRGSRAADSGVCSVSIGPSLCRPRTAPRHRGGVRAAGERPAARAAGEAARGAAAA